MGLFVCSYFAPSSSIPRAKVALTNIGLYGVGRRRREQSIIRASGISGASRTFVTNRNRSTRRTMRSRILYLLRFALVVLLSFLVLKGCFLLLVPAEGALSMGDIFAVLYHGLSLDFSVLGYLLVIPLLTTAVSCFFRAFPARRALRP